MSQYRTYIDPPTGEALFYHWDPSHGGWTPDIHAMHAWRTGTLRAYRPGPDMFITMPGHVQRPIMTEAELHDICGTVNHPWIPEGAAVAVSESDIAQFDAWSYTMEPDNNVPTAWETTAVPLLHYDTDIIPQFFTSYNQDEEVVASTLLAIRRQETPVPSAPPVSEPRTGPLLPRHVAVMVLSAAVTAGATCPISMEPIQSTGSSVTGCGHVFQTEALRQWGRDTCPECRTPTGSTAF
jgi:hypothetical protein